MGVFKPAITLEDAENICKSVGITLIHYSGKGREKSQLRCDRCGHEWQTPILNIKKGRSCPNCKVKFTIVDNTSIASGGVSKSLPDTEDIVSLLPKINALLAVAPILIKMAEHEQEIQNCAAGMLKNPAQIAEERKQKAEKEERRQRMREIEIEYLDMMEPLRRERLDRKYGRNILNKDANHGS